MLVSISNNLLELQRVATTSLRHCILNRRRDVDSSECKACIEAGAHCNGIEYTQRGKREALDKVKPLVLCTAAVFMKLKNNWIDKTSPTMIFIDEATKLTDFDLAAVLSKCRSGKLARIVLAGDPKQMGVYLAGEIRTVYDILDVILKRYTGFPMMTTHSQRMLYGNTMFLSTERHSGKLVSKKESLPWFRVLRVFGNFVTEGQGSKSSSVQTDETVKIVDKLVTKGKRVAIVCFYRGQLAHLQRAFTKDVRDQIRIATVDGFQGKEEEVVVLVTTRNEATDFFGDEQRLTVALSRAKTMTSVVAADELIQQSLRSEEKHLLAKAMTFCQNEEERFDTIVDTIEALLEGDVNANKFEVPQENDMTPVRIATSTSNTLELHLWTTTRG